jgi:hypothetical protein
MAKTIAAAEFEGHSLELFEEVADNDEELVVLSNGKPLVKVVPATRPDRGHPARKHRSLEELRGSVTILGDIVEPLGDEWETSK